MTLKSPGRDEAFRLVEFLNPATGTTSWRVTGYKDGKRVRENYASRPRAEARRLELEIARLGAKTTDQLRATWLSTEQIKAAESVFARQPDVKAFLKAYEWWEGVGAKHEAATAHAKDMTLDDAWTKFDKWLNGTPSIREATKKNFRSRVRLFTSEIGNIALRTVTPEVIETWLDKRQVSPVTRNNDKRALSRFFGWCVERPQRFLTHNPASGIRVELPEGNPPEIFSVREVMRLLVAARKAHDGKFLRWIVLQLFGGMRPTEAARFEDSWLKDGHITIPKNKTKTGRGRSFQADPLLLAWLKLCQKGELVDRPAARRNWEDLKKKAGLKRWIHDGLRHTAISHYFRRCGSYGLTAEWAGNSEQIIKQHYQGRVSVAEAAKFWAMFPSSQQRKKLTGGAKAT